jgi:anti-sigma-K factor RskA
VNDSDKNSAGSGSYVLNAMDANERDDFEAQLAESEELRNEVTELTDTAVLLGLAVPPVTPPPALKQNIMARLSGIPQLAPDDEPERLAPVTVLRAVPAGADVASPALTKARARWYRRPGVIVAASVAAVVLVFGGVYGASVALQGSSSSQQATALAAISSASDVQRAEASVSTGGTATLVWSNMLGKSALIGKNLKPLPSNKTYEAWYINSAGQAIGAGLFESSGKSTLQVLTGTMRAGDTIGVTVEPAGGSTSPTTKPIVAIASA